MTLSEALADSSYRDLVEATVGDVFERNPECRECAYRTRCLGGCRAKGEDEHGNPDAMCRDPGACRYFQGGYYERARGVVERCQQGKGDVLEPPLRESCRGLENGLDR